MKRIGILLFALIIINNYLFSQEVFKTEIEAKYFILIETAYRDIETKKVDLSEYNIQIRIENKILHVRFYRPDSKSWRGSPPGYPVFNYEIDVTTGKIIRIQGER